MIKRDFGDPISQVLELQVDLTLVSFLADETQGS